MRKAEWERRYGVLEVLEDQRKAEIGKQLEPREPLTSLLEGPAEQVQGPLRILERDHRRGAGLGHREKLQDRRGDHPQRPFRSNEELLEIVAGIVLAQSAQAVPDLPRGQDNLKAQQELARVAIAQHGRAARVRRKVTADLAASFGGETQ